MTLRLYPEMEGDEGFFSPYCTSAVCFLFSINERRFNIYEFRKI
ncbi:hypothetical protein ANACAC_03581 [Anaerostipes caccae L1-92]|uniref:Uncharacterized protein n=1 Tax=Anaerostipes caccae (strain DSM 14662 / CCUG 47493 / JCM 13470 / NCIMB 13811 / L1-92) TaxID=411490 RepID=B0MIX6_ANACD|nr:hypothetical protein ANACAC_03581 [Anaerostipes caccae L1-92]